MKDFLFSMSIKNLSVDSFYFEKNENNEMKDNSKEMEIVQTETNEMKDSNISINTRNTKFISY